MERRDLLRAIGATTALSLAPREAVAAWMRVSQARTSALSPSQTVLVGAIADTILPRTDSPSATDVGVPAFVDVIVSENYTDADRQSFLTGLDALAAQLNSSTGTSFVELPVGARGDAIGAVEALDRRAEPARTYWRLKGLVIHGYFTAERVMKNVLHHEIMPGSYNGNAPMPTKTPARAGDHAHG